jgi:hypothetical protein
MMHAPAASAPMSMAASKASGAMAGAAGVFGKLAQAIGGGRARGDKMVRSKRRDGPVEELRELDAGVSDASPGDAGAERDALYAILLTQAADGSFPESDALMAAVKDAMALTALRAKHGDGPVLTALALALLERDHADRRPEWQAAADKARRHLGGTTIDVAAAM